MNTSPETEIRDALGEAAGVTGLTFDPATVLDRGHRFVRRRRLATAGLGIAAVAVVAVVAVQVAGGTNRSQPPAGNPTSTGVSTPIPARPRPWPTSPARSTRPARCSRVPTKPATLRATGLGCR